MNKTNKRAVRTGGKTEKSPLYIEINCEKREVRFVDEIKGKLLGVEKLSEATSRGMFKRAEESGKTPSQVIGEIISRGVGTGEKRHKTSITIEETKLEAIKKAAARQGLSVSSYLESFIDRIIPDIEKELSKRAKAA